MSIRHDEIELRVLVKVHLGKDDEGKLEDITDEFTSYETQAIAYLVRQALMRE